MDRFTNQVVKYIRDHELMQPGDAVTVGFSGGADSVCLLCVLSEVRQLLGISLQAVHVNHHLRGDEAQRDEAFCQAAAHALGIPFRAEQVDVAGTVKRTGMTEEEAGRVLRYGKLQEAAAAFAKVQGGSAVIAVAHHADDQAETILLNLLRGSGLKGLGGMQPKRENIVRPLLGVSREEILAFLDGRQQAFVEDSTNAENDHTRNRLRNVVIPELKRSVNERSSEHIAAAGALIGEADAYLTQEAKRFLDGGEGCYEDEAGLALKLQQTLLKEKAQILRRYVIIEGLRRLGVPLKDWGEKHFSDIDKALYGGRSYHVDLPGNAFAENEYKETILHIRR